MLSKRFDNVVIPKSHKIKTNGRRPTSNIELAIVAITTKQQSKNIEQSAIVTVYGSVESVNISKNWSNQSMLLI